ncbi:hypothetical protein CEUSTIGMA_g5107.t1 [Chlamydomonas eustigma]|uniref:Transmembrane protein n=1 Tax=Chlamydomonas eustigma TaxID=1157962 RepID=A0A250X3K8_9CHLO|nr:hypothetical protein CEUSTIGMA_g5107.t1 [Chlamydomonas eustigma]|eukprot:GAX77664.1 hypothetical protein CEUSTIGMA_g5107.t1 [Chlamydomonas eustigma]
MQQATAATLQSNPELNNAQGTTLPGTTAQSFVAPAKKPKRKVLTSLTLQIFLYFGGWWDVFYYVLNILVFVYKGLTLPYPTRNFAMEFSFAWLWFIIDIPRIFLISKGNKTETCFPLFMSWWLNLPLLGLYIYYIKFETYVLKIDLILSGISLGFVGVQFFLSIVFWFVFLLSTKFAS